jgi:quercetin dioxygenase-like cupin family protein
LAGCEGYQGRSRLFAHQPPQNPRFPSGLRTAEPFHDPGAETPRAPVTNVSQTPASLIWVKPCEASVSDTGCMSEQPLIDATREKIVSLENETQFAANGIVSRTLLRASNGRVVLFGFAEGQELTEHTSTQQTLIQILSGECEFSLAGKARAMKAGDLLYMPPNLPHAVKATKQFSMLLTLLKPA